MLSESVAQAIVDMLILRVGLDEELDSDNYKQKKISNLKIICLLVDSIL